MGGGIAEIAVLAGGIHDNTQESYFGRYFAPWAGGLPLLRRKTNMQQQMKNFCIGWSECAQEGVRVYPFHRIAIDIGRSTDSPGASALLRVRLLFAPFTPQKVIELQFGR